MQTISISIPGEELESITVDLSAEEVRSIYLARKDLTTKLNELQKKFDELTTSKKYADERSNVYSAELQHAHTLLTALGVQEKTNEEEAYYRKELPVATRIALYIATKS